MLRVSTHRTVSRPSVRRSLIHLGSRNQACCRTACREPGSRRGDDQRGESGQRQPWSSVARGLDVVDGQAMWSCGRFVRSRYLARGRNDDGVPSGNAADKLAKKIADSNRGASPAPPPTTSPTGSAASPSTGSARTPHPLRRLRPPPPHPRHQEDRAPHRQGRRHVPRPTLHHCQCCAQGLDTERKSAARLASAAGSDCPPQPRPTCTRSSSRRWNTPYCALSGGGSYCASGLPKTSLGVMSESPPTGSPGGSTARSCW